MFVLVCALFDSSLVAVMVIFIVVASLIALFTGNWLYASNARSCSCATISSAGTDFTTQQHSQHSTLTVLWFSVFYAFNFARFANVVVVVVVVLRHILIPIAVQRIGMLLATTACGT